MAAGDFSHSGANAVGRVARWNGTEWLSLEEGLDAGSDAVMMVGGSLYMGGEFSMAGSHVSAHVSRWGDGRDGIEYVPAEFASINAAVLSATEPEQTADIVLAPGFYDEVVRDLGKGFHVRIRGCGDPEQTVVRRMNVVAEWHSVRLSKLTVQESSTIWSEEMFRFEDCIFQGALSAACDYYSSVAQGCEFRGAANFFAGAFAGMSIRSSRAYDGLDVSLGEDVGGDVTDCWINGELMIGGTDWTASAVRCTVNAGDLIVDSDGVSVSGCVVLGGGIRASAYGGNFGFSNNVKGNLVVGGEIGIRSFSGEDIWNVNISGNTVVGTGTSCLVSGGGTNMDVRIEQNLLVGNDLGLSIMVSDPQPLVSCNTFWNNATNASGIPDPIGLDGNFEANPWFCDPDAGDYRLTTQSPCLPGNHPAGADCGLIGALGAGCTLLADMVVGQVLCSPDTTFWSGDGDSVAIGAVVTNGGLFPTEPSFARIEVTGCIGFWGDTRAIAALQPGESDTAWVGPFPRDLVACEVDITADFFDDVVEADEDNNAVAGVMPCAVVGVDEDLSAGPLPLRLHVPNPWRAGGEIRFSGADAERVDIFDVSGRRVRSWRVDASGQSLAWDTRDEAGRAVRPGRYFLRLVGRDETTTRAITVLR